MIKRCLCILVILSCHAQATSLCAIEHLEVEEEASWLSRLEDEFGKEITEYSEGAAAIEQIPSLLLSRVSEEILPAEWEALQATLERGPSSTFELSSEQQKSSTRMLMKSLTSEIASTIFQSVSTAADIVILLPWYEDIYRTFWDESKTGLDKVTAFTQIIPVIGSVFEYYDNLSHLDSIDRRLENFNKQGYYSYAVDSPALLVNSTNQRELQAQFNALHLHINELMKRMVDVHLLHYDGLYTSKVLEVQGLLDRQFAEMDREYFKTQLTYSTIYEEAGHFGEELCVEEKAPLIEAIKAGRVATPREEEALRRCNYENTANQLFPIWGIGTDEYRAANPNSLFEAKQRLVDRALEHIDGWRNKTLQAQKEAINKAKQSILSSPDIQAYWKLLYKKSREVSIRNFALQVIGRQPTYKELETGRFLQHEGKLVCGIYSCQKYYGREVIYDEANDPVLKRLRQPLMTLIVDAYLDDHVKHGWTRQELNAPFKALWQQWQNRNDTKQRALPYLGNPSVDVIEDTLPKLAAILERIPDSTAPQQAVTDIVNAINQGVSQQSMDASWQEYGDFIFRAQFLLRQQLSANSLPMQWQQTIWPGKVHGVMYNTYLAKPYLYFSSQPWVEELPFYSARTTEYKWYLQMDWGQNTYLTESVSDEVLLTDKYWQDMTTQLAHVVDQPAVRWKPFERVILMDLLEQAIEMEALVEAAR